MRTYLGELILVAGDEVEVGGDGGGCHDSGGVEAVGGFVGWSWLGLVVVL